MLRKALVTLVVILVLAMVGLAAWYLRPRLGPKNSVVLIIRHAEKPSSGPGLTAAGERRAKAYPAYFRNFQVDGKPLDLKMVFGAADTSESQRSHLTVKPLTNVNKLPLSLTYKQRQTDDLAEALREHEDGRNVLICWHHGEIPGLLKELGAKPGELLPGGEWPDIIYDWVIQLTFDAEGHLVPEKTKRLAEHLMPGDA